MSGSRTSAGRKLLGWWIIWRRFADHNRTTVGIYDLRLLQAKPPASSPQRLASVLACCRLIFFPNLFGSKDVLYGKLDRSKKIPLTTLLRAFGLSSDKKIVDFFGKYDGFPLTFEKDFTKDSDEAAIEVYSKLRQGEKVSPEDARSLIRNRLFDEKRYDLADVGRYKFNKKLDVCDRLLGNYIQQNLNLVIVDKNNGEVLYDGGVIAKNTLITEKEVEMINQYRVEHNKYEEFAGPHAFRQEVVLDTDLVIYQDDDWFKFSLDSVLLSKFVTINLRHKRIIDLATGNAPIPLLLSRLG